MPGILSEERPGVLFHVESAGQADNKKIIGDEGGPDVWLTLIVFLVVTKCQSGGSGICFVLWGAAPVIFRMRRMAGPGLYDSILKII